MTSPDTEPEPALVERTSVLAGDPALARERDTALGALTTVRAASLAPLVRAVAVADAHALTHLVPAGAVELAALREKVPLRPGHVVTVLGAVLDALDAVHRAHLAHGGATAERVLVAPDGSVVLAGCGLAWSVPPGCPTGPLAADDVAEVAVLARRLLGAGSAPPALVLALLRAADPDPSLRPDAASLAVAVRAALPAEPLLDLLWVASPRARPAQPYAAEADDAAPDTAQPYAVGADDAAPTTDQAAPPRVGGGTAVLRSPRALPRRGRPRRGGAATVAAVVAAVALPLVAWGALRQPTGAAADQAAPSPVPSTTPAPAADPVAPTKAPPSPTTTAAPATDWAAVLRGLDDVRHRAVVAGSTSLLAQAVDPRGSAWDADAALAARVRREGVRLRGGALVPSSVDLLGTAADRVRLRVRDVRTAYDVTAGGVTTRVGARSATTWEVTLVRSATGWRIGDVSAASARAQ